MLESILKRKWVTSSLFQRRCEFSTSKINWSWMWSKTAFFQTRLLLVISGYTGYCECSFCNFAQHHLLFSFRQTLFIHCKVVAEERTVTKQQFVDVHIGAGRLHSCSMRCEPNYDKVFFTVSSQIGMSQEWWRLSRVHQRLPIDACSLEVAENSPFTRGCRKATHLLWSLKEDANPQRKERQVHIA